MNPVARRAAAVSAGFGRWRRLATVRLVGAPIKGSSVTEGVGVVEGGGGAYEKGDLVYASKLSGSWGETGGVLTVDDGSLTKLPGAPSLASAAHLGAAATACSLLGSAVAGDVVVLVGGEGAVGQVAAQVAAARGVKLVSLVSPDVADAEDAVDVLKNLGATVAAPADFAASPTFRSVVADLGTPSLLLVEGSKFDAQSVDGLLAAAAQGTAKGRVAVEAADPVDVRDAKLLQTCAALLSPGAKILCYDATTGGLPALGAETLETTDVSAAAAALADLDLTVLSEAHSTATLPRALHLANGAVYKHAYRQPVWLAEEP